ncbi:MAG: hypothetical protein QOJ40_2800 [Verrucomicrobiota bacterium]
MTHRGVASEKRIMPQQENPQKKAKLWVIDPRSPLKSRLHRSKPRRATLFRKKMRQRPQNKLPARRGNRRRSAESQSVRALSVGARGTNHVESGMDGNRIAVALCVWRPTSLMIREGPGQMRKVPVRNPKLEKTRDCCVLESSRWNQSR